MWIISITLIFDKSTVEVNESRLFFQRKTASSPEVFPHHAAMKYRATPLLEQATSLLHCTIMLSVDLRLAALLYSRAALSLHYLWVSPEMNPSNFLRAETPLSIGGEWATQRNPGEANEYLKFISL